MRQKIWDNLLKNTKLQIVVGTIVVVLCLMVWPFQRFYHSEYSGGNEPIQLFYTDAVTMEEIVLQQILPKEGHIHDIRIDCQVENVRSQDRVFVTLYDADYEIVYQEVIYFTDIETLGYILITPDMDVETDKVYYIGLNVHYVSEGTLSIAYAPLEEVQVSECGVFAYASTTVPGMAVCMTIHYTDNFSGGLIVLCIIGIIMGGFLFCIGLTYVQHLIRQKKREPVVRNILLKITVIVAIMADAVCFYLLCIKKIFGTDKWDVSVYAIACVVVLIGTGSVYYCKKEKEAVDKHALSWNNYLQTVCFVFLFWAGIGYVNSAIQWKQDLSRNWVFMLFGIAVLLTFQLRELMNPITVLFAIIMIPCGMVYCHIWGVDEHALTCARVMVVSAVVWGVVLIRTIRSYRNLGKQAVNLLLAVCWVMMCILMIVNRYGKLWPILMTVSFSLFYLQNYSEKQKKQLVHNLINGILANFCFVVVMCLLYRPYHYYQFNRYPMWFHTVATTGMYLALVEAAAVLRLYMKMRENRTIWFKNEKEWILNAVVLSYISLTIARTTILAVLGVFIMMMIGTVIVYRVRFKRYMQALGVAVMLFLLCLPVVYTATRCIPAVVNEPKYLTETEDFDLAVKKGEALDSPNYMNVRALLRLWVSRTGVLKETLWKYLDDTALDASPKEIRILCDVVSREETAVYREDTGNTAGMSVMDDISNGRIGVFIAYLEKLNWNGHEQMSFEMEDGWTPGHAHNSFIQNAYDFGIPAGVLFLALILGMFCVAVYRIWIKKDQSEMQFFMLIVSAMMLLISLSEYASNPCMPICFSTLFMLITMRKEKNMV